MESGRIVSIVYKPADAPEAAGGFTRVPPREARLLQGFGIEGDLKGGSHNRHLNIMSAETTADLQEDGFKVAPGELGEQIVVSGIDVDRLQSGSRLRIGDAAEVEIVTARTGCVTFESHQGKLRQEASGRLGMMANVVSSGIIRVGDPVSVPAGEPALAF